VDGLPLEIGGGVFARFDRRTEIPWRTVLGVGAVGAYVVRVDVDGQTLTFESPRRAPPVEADLTMRSDQSAGRAELVDGHGTTVWEFDTGGLDPVDALRSTTRPTWLRWDGQRFVEIAAPWTFADRVAVIGVGDGALAVPTIDVNNSVDEVFWTSDGTDWQTVALPVPRSARSPVSVHAGNNAVVLSISSGDGTSSWSTTDGTTFHELPDVPGIERSSSGSFGHVAPDPRGNPLVRVSLDGQRWSTVDLSDELGTDSAQWNFTTDATAIGSTIYVTATNGDVRTLLIGTVGNTT